MYVCMYVCMYTYIYIYIYIYVNKHNKLTVHPQACVELGTPDRYTFYSWGALPMVT